MPARVREASALVTEKREFKAIKGTRDILPPDSALWNWFEQTARDVFESYNFRDIKLPIFEETPLFARSVGEETDIVSKEMYTFEDRPFALEKPKLIGDVGGFIHAVRKAAENGQIPRDEGNMSAIGDVEAIWKWFDGGGYEEAQADTNPSQKIYEMTLVAETIRLG